ncbi:GNAT family N-acetyltransferase [Sphingomonas sp.]|jgi:GNAT superfamily N-acetyltransferase|uniref:GNAT family N-acetyltransferase n=1 Tax=Sphingomonas sp. TaxID=28214 RepID=UPI002DF085A1|nr:GNAT family N-acetyltransferase [Sphingomonas sp.]HEV2567334.1 GNAT family N-acetyltransferase [Sphingomonas sp.]
MSLSIRIAKAEDAAALPAIERAAGALFRALPDLAWIADGEPMAEAAYRLLIAQGHCWVAGEKDRLVGFLAAERAGPELHIVELSVLPEKQGIGIGRALIQAALTRAENDALTGVTLTTFRDVPWNAPFYARLGFKEVPPRALNARLAGIRAKESRQGLPAERRCAMRFPLGQD